MTSQGSTSSPDTSEISQSGGSDSDSSPCSSSCNGASTDNSTNSNSRRSSDKNDSAARNISESDRDFPDSGSDEGFSDDDSDENMTSESPMAEQPEIEEELAQEDKRLDDRFTSEQLDKLLSLKEEYRHGSFKERRELALKVGEEFRDSIIQAGTDLTDSQVANLFDHVKMWFSQRARTRRELLRWTVHWTGRQVFYKENSELVARTQQMLYNAQSGKGLPVDKNTQADFNPSDSGEEEDEFDDDTTCSEDRKSTPFSFFQRALSAEWNSLHESERDEYKEKAMQWRMEGPSDEARKALAEKEACRVLRFLAEDLFRQMGVRLFVLASYEDSNDEIVAVSLDFNKDLGSHGRSFKQGAKSYLEKINLLENYAAFVKKTAPPEEEVVDRKATARDITFEINGRGEAILPNPSSFKPGVLQAHEYFPNLMRKYMHFDWARAQGARVKRTNGPSWSEIGTNLDLYIDRKYLPRNVALPIKDPGVYTLANCKALIDHWWQRQKMGLTPFRFKGYYRDGRFRERDAEATDDPADSDYTPSSPAFPPPSKSSSPSPKPLIPAAKASKANKAPRPTKPRNPKSPAETSTPKKPVSLQESDTEAKPKPKHKARPKQTPKSVKDESPPADRTMPVPPIGIPSASRSRKALPSLPFDGVSQLGLSTAHKTTACIEPTDALSADDVLSAAAQALNLGGPDVRGSRGYPENEKKANARIAPVGKPEDGCDTEMSPGRGGAEKVNGNGKGRVNSNQRKGYDGKKNHAKREDEDLRGKGAANSRANKDNEKGSTKNLGKNQDKTTAKNATNEMAVGYRDLTAEAEPPQVDMGGEVKKRRAKRGEKKDTGEIQEDDIERKTPKGKEKGLRSNTKVEVDKKQKGTSKKRRRRAEEHDDSKSQARVQDGGLMQSVDETQESSRTYSNMHRRRRDGERGRVAALTPSVSDESQCSGPELHPTDELSAGDDSGASPKVHATEKVQGKHARGKEYQRRDQSTDLPRARSQNASRSRARVSAHAKQDEDAESTEMDGDPGEEGDTETQEGVRSDGRGKVRKGSGSRVRGTRGAPRGAPTQADEASFEVAPGATIDIDALTSPQDRQLVLEAQRFLPTGARAKKRTARFLQ